MIGTDSKIFEETLLPQLVIQCSPLELGSIYGHSEEIQVMGDFTTNTLDFHKYNQAKQKASKRELILPVGITVIG